MFAMSNIEKIVELLEEKVTSLREKFDRLKADNEQFKNQISVLSNQNAVLMNEIERWKQENKSLKIANSILGSNENKTEAKQKINALIREIDACIVQLSKS